MSEGQSPDSNALNTLIGISISIFFSFTSALGTSLQSRGLAVLREANEEVVNIDDASSTEGEISESDNDLEASVDLPEDSAASLVDSTTPTLNSMERRPASTNDTPLLSNYMAMNVSGNDTSPTRRRNSLSILRGRADLPRIPLDTYTRNTAPVQPKQLVKGIRRQRRRENMWELYYEYEWYLGFGAYVFSQLFGSVFALAFISPMLLAPLGSVGLIANIVFSRWLLRTPITRWNIFGTILIVIGCAIVSAFGARNPSTRLSMDDLISLYTRPAFAIFMSLEVALALGVFIVVVYLERFRLPASSLSPLTPLTPPGETSPLLSRKNGRSSVTLRRFWKRVKISRVIGALYAAVGGTAASETLLIGKSGVDSIISSLIPAKAQPDGSSHVAFSLLLLLFFLYSLNRGLHYSLPLEVVPVFYTFFTALALANQSVFLGGAYNVAETLLVLLGMTIIIGGVWILGWSDAPSLPMSLSSPTTPRRSHESTRRSLFGRRPHESVEDNGDADRLMIEAELFLSQPAGINHEDNL
ncbi:hypothetical protein SmJEL517_g03152 [Synchytrium microbalum]|uniref:Uncharacterized protein n=1 Tax=Synchytrium microbalum TaxID=1806994 RepID=A0A507C3D4_9FUNG|nr:uncharacterized protein SmJEL517_g03152 [Synchytrium microbalum]TPX34172.1 hypothetical protein SmJEL517_g03152 [Synchytrium microbalum]